MFPIVLADNGKCDGVICTPIQKEQPANENVPKNPVASPTSKGSQEITKKQLLELSKSDMTAQAINIKYNEMNKFLLAEMRRVQGKVSEHPVLLCYVQFNGYYPCLLPWGQWNINLW